MNTAASPRERAARAFARADPRADVRLGMQLAGPEDGRHRACAAHVPLADAAVRGARPVARRAPVRRFDPHPARVVAPCRDARAVQHRRLERLHPVRRPAVACRTKRDPRLHDAALGDGIATLVLHEPLASASSSAWRSGMAGMAAAARRRVPRHPREAVRRRDDPRRSRDVGLRHGAAAQMEAAVSAERAVELDDAAGWLPIVALAPVFDPRPLGNELAALSWRGWFALGYNIFLAGTSRTGRGSISRARCRLRCRRCRRSRCRSSASSPE